MFRKYGMDRSPPKVKLKSGEGKMMSIIRHGGGNSVSTLWRLVTHITSQLHWSHTRQRNDSSLCWHETRSHNLWITHLPLSKDGRPQRITLHFLSQKYSKTTKACTDQQHNSTSNPTDTDAIKQRTSWTPKQRWTVNNQTVRLCYSGREENHSLGTRSS